MSVQMIDWKSDLAMLDEAERTVYSYLEQLGTAFVTYHHEATPTAADVAAMEDMIQGKHCKNLFLKNSKGDALYLLIVPHDKEIYLPQVARLIGSTRLSFAPSDWMQRYLGLNPGSASPFGLLNDEAGQVNVLLDAALKRYDWICFHPNIGTATLSMPINGLEQFLQSRTNPWQYLEI